MRSYDYWYTYNANFRQIVKAARAHRRVLILYKKKYPKKRIVVFRKVAFYSFRDGMLFGTDTKSGATQIKSFLIKNIKSVKVLDIKFKPKWGIKL
jgi:hypothetical protein